MIDDHGRGNVFCDHGARETPGRIEWLAMNVYAGRNRYVGRIPYLCAHFMVVAGEGVNAVRGALQVGRDLPGDDGSAIEPNDEFVRIGDLQTSPRQ